MVRQTERSHSCTIHARIFSILRVDGTGSCRFEERRERMVVTVRDLHPVSGTSDDQFFLNVRPRTSGRADMKNFEQPVMRCVHKRAAFTFGQPLSFVLGSTVICLLTGRPVFCYTVKTVLCRTNDVHLAPPLCTDTPGPSFDLRVLPV